MPTGTGTICLNETAVQWNSVSMHFHILRRKTELLIKCYFAHEHVSLKLKFMFVYTLKRFVPHRQTTSPTIWTHRLFGLREASNSALSGNFSFSTPPVRMTKISFSVSTLSHLHVSRTAEAPGTLVPLAVCTVPLAGIITPFAASLIFFMFSNSDSCVSKAKTVSEWLLNSPGTLDINTEDSLYSGLQCLSIEQYKIAKPMSLSGMMRLPLDFKYPVKQQIQTRQKIKQICHWCQAF